MYGYGQSQGGSSESYYGSRDPYGYDQRPYEGDSRRQAPQSTAPQSWYDMTLQDNMASPMTSRAPTSQSLNTSGGGGGASAYNMGQSQRSNTYPNSNLPPSDWNHEKAAQAVAFLQNVDQKEKRHEEMENQKMEVQRLRQEVQKSMETLQHLKSMQDPDGNVPGSPRYQDNYRRGPVSGAGYPGQGRGHLSDTGPPRSAASSGQVQAPRSILKKPRRPGEEDAHEDDQVRTNYCDICSIQFNTSREYHQHCAGLLHTKQLMQQKMGIPVSQTQSQSPGMSASKGPAEKMQYPASSGNNWSDKDAETVKSAFNDYDYDYDESSGSQMSHFKASRYEEGGNVECKLCDKKFYTFQELRNHAAQPEHCKIYLVMQASLGTDKFMAKFGDVHFTMPHKDTSGPGDRYIRTDLSPRDQMRYKEFLARSGTLNNWTCKICNANTFMMEHWLAHCCGKKHAKACMSKIAVLSSEDYLRTFGDIPGPAPSKAVDAKMIEKWETVYIIDVLKKPPLMSNLQKEQILKQASVDNDVQIAGPTTGLLGDFPGDKDQGRQPPGNSRYSHSQQSPYGQSQDQSAYGGQSSSRTPQQSPYNQQQSPYGQPKPPQQTPPSSASPYSQQQQSGYGQRSSGYGQEASPYGQQGRPTAQSAYDRQESPYRQNSPYDQMGPSGHGSFGMAGRPVPPQGGLPYGQEAPHQMGSKRPDMDYLGEPKRPLGPGANDSPHYPGQTRDPYGNPYHQPGPTRDMPRMPDFGGPRSSYPDRGPHEQASSQRDSSRERSRDHRDTRDHRDRDSRDHRDNRDHRDHRDSRDHRDNRDHRDSRDHRDGSRDNHSRTSSAGKDKPTSKSGMYDPFEQEAPKGKAEEKDAGKEGVVSTTKALQMLHQLQEKQRLEQEKLEKKLKEQKDMLERQKREMEVQKRKHQEEIEKQNRQLQEEKKRLEEEKKREEQRRREKERELERERKLRLEELRRQQQMKDDLERKRLQRQKEELERKKLEKIKEEQDRKAQEEKARQDMLAKQLRMKLELEQKLKEELEAKKREQERKAQEEKQKAEEMRRIREKEEELQRLLNAKKLELEAKNKTQQVLQNNSPWQRGQGRGAMPPPRYPGTPRNLIAVPRAGGPRPPFVPNQQFARPLIPVPPAVTPIPQVAPGAQPQQGDLVNSAPWNAAGGAAPNPAKPGTSAPWNKGQAPNKNQTPDKNKGNNNENSEANPPWGGGKKGGTGGNQQTPPWAGKGPDPKNKKDGEPAPWNAQGKKQEDAPWKGRDGNRRKDAENSGGRKTDEKDSSREDMPWKRRGNGRGRGPSPRDRRSGRDDRGRSRDDDRDRSGARGRDDDRGSWRDNRDRDRDRDRSRGRDSSERRRRRTPPPESDIANEAPWHRKEGGEGFETRGGNKPGRENVEGGAPWAARRPGDTRKQPIEPGHCYKIVLDKRQLVDWQMAQEDFIRCMDKGQNMDQPLRVFTNTLRELMGRIQAEKDNLPTDAIMSSLSPEERGVVGQIQRMTGLEPASVVVCTLQLLQSMAPRVFNILGSMDPNFMQSLIADAMAGPVTRGDPGAAAGAQGRDITPPWMRGTKRPGEQSYPEKRGKWN